MERSLCILSKSLSSPKPFSRMLLIIKNSNPKCLLRLHVSKPIINNLYFTFSSRFKWKLAFWPLLVCQNTHDFAPADSKDWMLVVGKPLHNTPHSSLNLYSYHFNCCYSIIGWLIKFICMSTSLGLYYALRWRNSVHCTFIIIFFALLFIESLQIIIWY